MDPNPPAREVAVGIVVAGYRFGTGAARVALGAPVIGRPLRGAANALAEGGRQATAQGRARLEALLGDILAAPEVERAITAVLEREATAQRLDRVLASPGLERLLVRVLESRLVLELTDRILASPGMQHTLRHMAESPELRRALAEQSSGLAEEMAEGVRRRTEVLDDAAERVVRGWLRRRPRPA